MKLSKKLNFIMLQKFDFSTASFIAIFNNFGGFSKQHFKILRLSVYYVVHNQLLEFEWLSPSVYREMNRYHRS